MSEKKMNMEQGHWILAKLGKRVLRPGGRELTGKMMEALSVDVQDDVVEFAPGLGLTARLAVAHKPHSYTGVELNEEAAAIVRRNVPYSKARVIVGDAARTELPDGCATKVYGEAMLTMQSLQQKELIIANAARLLKPGGLYGIHEICLGPDALDEQTKDRIGSDLAHGIRANVRPLTRQEWLQMLEKYGFEVVTVEQAPMHLLERKRMIQDEGLPRTLLILFRILFNSKARRRVLHMRATFRRHEKHMSAIVIVARKRQESGKRKEN